MAAISFKQPLLSVDVDWWRHRWPDQISVWTL